VSENIQEAKLAIMAAVPYVRKTPKGKGGQGLPYSYASEVDIIKRVRPAMLAEGVSVAPKGCEMIDSRTLTTGKGTMMLSRCLAVTYRFTHAASDTHEDVVVVAEAFDSSDKAASKAMTQALKYAVRQWLYIETGDDPDQIQQVDAMHLSPAAERAREAIHAAETADDLASVEKRVAGSSNIGAAERAYLVEALQAKRSETLDLDELDVNPEANDEQDTEE